MAVQQKRGPSRALARWEPVQDLEQVTDRMRRMLSETLGSDWALLKEAAAWVPSVDIEETDDSYVIEAELPGVDKKDINIELVGNELTITGEVKEKERKGIVRKQTRRIGRFDYRVRLPEQLESDKIDADLKDGVLTVSVPKSERASRKKIEIKS